MDGNQRRRGIGVQSRVSHEGPRCTQSIPHGKTALPASRPARREPKRVSLPALCVQVDPIWLLPPGPVGPAPNGPALAPQWQAPPRTSSGRLDGDAHLQRRGQRRARPDATTCVDFAKQPIYGVHNEQKDAGCCATSTWCPVSEPSLLTFAGAYPGTGRAESRWAPPMTRSARRESAVGIQPLRRQLDPAVGRANKIFSLGFSVLYRKSQGREPRLIGCGRPTRTRSTIPLYLAIARRPACLRLDCFSRSHRRRASAGLSPAC